jgi:hypothetical protein
MCFSSIVECAKYLRNLQGSLASGLKNIRFNCLTKSASKHEAPCSDALVTVAVALFPCLAGLFFFLAAACNPLMQYGVKPMPVTLTACKIKSNA